MSEGRVNKENHAKVADLYAQRVVNDLDIDVLMELCKDLLEKDYNNNYTPEQLETEIVEQCYDDLFDSIGE